MPKNGRSPDELSTRRRPPSAQGRGSYLPSDPTFHCPLRGRCFHSVGTPFASARLLNATVAEFQSSPPGTSKDDQVETLFRRCLPLIAKSLSRFCPYSNCRRGECLPEELLGATYVIFAKALDDYRPSRGLDFLGYATQRLHWGLRHELRRLKKAQPAILPPGDDVEASHRGEGEAQILDRLFLTELLADVGEADAALIGLRYAADHSPAELARMTGLSSSAVRKRIERLRARLRTRIAASA